VEAGRAVEDVAREYGVSKHTIYAWKSKYVRIPSDADQRSEVMAIAIPN